MSRDDQADLERRLRRWRGVARAAWTALFAPFVLSACAVVLIVATRGSERTPAPSWAFASAGLGALVLFVAAFVLLGVSQRRRMALALERSHSTDVLRPDETRNLRGAASNAWINVGYPLAQLVVSSRRIRVSVLGFEWLASESADVCVSARLGWFGGGVVLTTREREVRFLALDPERLVATLRGAGYAIERAS